MNTIKIRLELHLETGDTVVPEKAVAEALESLAMVIGKKPLATAGMAEVRRGKAAWGAELRGSGPGARGVVLATPDGLKYVDQTDGK